ncbi:MAG: phytase [Chlorobiaceae bacterium]|nr:phytase [Chlorobiaceae bacterium]NTV60360.1 phytase [Chlorobiaceae bacterium]
MNLWIFNSLVWALLLFFVTACSLPGRRHVSGTIRPVVITEKVRYDSDDPAIWIDRAHPEKSLVLGTDKDVDGSLFVFDLNGRILPEKTVHGLRRPNNVDVEYGLVLNGKPVDIAVVTERLTGKLRIFSLPAMEALDGGGIPVFAGEADRSPMGIALYKRASDGSVYALVSRKHGPADGTYLWQYRLEDDGNGRIRGVQVRKFGKWSGKKEIEAVAVDDDAGYVFYSDEGVGVRQYLADPDAPGSGNELSLFATGGFMQDHEGIAVCSGDDGKPVVIVSDQGAGKLHVFSTADHGNERSSRALRISAIETDGIDATAEIRTSRFPHGILVAMSDDGRFHYYSLQDLGF